MISLTLSKLNSMTALLGIDYMDDKKEEVNHDQ